MRLQFDVLFDDSIDLYKTKMAGITEHLTILWSAFPSVNRYAVEHRAAAPALMVEVEKFIEALFKSTHINADFNDSKQAFDSFLSTMPPLPPLEAVPPLINSTTLASDETKSVEVSEGSQPLEEKSSPIVEIGTVSFAFFTEHVLQKLCREWVPPGESLRRNKPRPTSPPEVAATPVPSPAKKGSDKKNVAPQAPPEPTKTYTPEEEAYETQLEAIVASLVDDRSPRVYLPFEDVITVPLARRLSVKLRSFCTPVTHPVYPPCYDAMWDAVRLSPNTEVASRDNFVTWFVQWLTRCFTNVTPKRAQIAANTHWLDAITATGQMDKDCFVNVARKLSHLYLSEEGDLFFAEHVSAVNTAISGTQRRFLDATPEPRALRAALGDVDKLFVPDELSPRKQYSDFFRSASENRIILIGAEGLGKASFASKLAARLNAVDVNIFSLALNALDNADKGDALGHEIDACVKALAPIPLNLQAKLVRRCLEENATRYRGFVFGGMPPLTEANRDTVNDFIATCGFTDPPTAVVEFVMPSELYEQWRSRSREAEDSKYQEELRVRAAEDSLAAEKAQLQAQRAERKAARQRLADRRAKIESGEAEETEEYKKNAEVLSLGGEDEDDPPELDEEGNPLEPDQIAARDAAKTAASARRRVMADLSYQLRAGSAVPLDVPQIDSLSLQAWGDVIDRCTSRNRLLRVTATDDADARIDFIFSRLSLVATILPQMPTVPSESIDGIEPGPDGDNMKADLFRNAMIEAGMVPSPFESFCPVTKLENGVLVSGSWAYSCHFCGSMYCFASEEKLRKFMDWPTVYVTQSPNAHSPVLLIAKTRQATEGLSAADLFASLASQLDLTPLDLESYALIWRSYDAEVSRREELEATRKVADEAALGAREDRQRKLREAEMKKGKSKTTAPKKRKEAEENTEKEAPIADAEIKPPEEESAPRVQSTSERIQEEIDIAFRQQQETTLPVLVSCLEAISRDTILWLLQRRALPETVVVLDLRAPRSADDDGEEEEGEAIDNDSNDGKEGDNTQIGEDGNPIPPKPKVDPPFDQNNERMYNKLLKKLLDEFTTVPDENENPGATQSRRRQNFSVTTINVYNMSVHEAISTILHGVRRVKEKVSLPQEGEELVADAADDADEDEADDTTAATEKLCRPGKRAAHQFGLTLRYCPVTLKESGTLVSGDPAHWASFLSDKYLFVSAEALEKFCANPDRYLPPSLPPPRLWVLGVAGHDTLAATLSSRFDIPVFSTEEHFLRSLLAHATNPAGGGDIMGTKVPYTNPDRSANLRSAIEIVRRLDEFEATEAAKLKSKEAAVAKQAEREAVLADGGEVSDIEEEEEEALQKAIEFEPEDEEAKTERVARELRHLAALLMRIDPFESRGYILVGCPKSEAELEQLLSFGAYPETVVNVKIALETYVDRFLNSEHAKRVEAHTNQVKQLTVARRQQAMRRRVAELAKWRRRNIGDDSNDVEQEEDVADDPEAPSTEGTRADLEARYETELSNVTALLSLLPEKRIPLIEVNGNLGSETIIRTAVAQLSANLVHRRSFLENPYVVTYAQALDLIQSGRKFLSSMRFTDPVSLAAERSGAPPSLKFRPAGRGIPPEPIIPDPEPEAPKPKRFKTVTRLDEETNEEIQVEVTDDEADDEPAEPEHFEEEPEPEPELSPEELEEMKSELDAKRKAMAEKLMPRAAVLRNRIFFFKSNENLLTFLTENPLNFWDQPPPPLYVPTLVAVMDSQVPCAPYTDVERPRTMAEHLAYNMGALFLDAPKLLKWATVALQGTQLATRALETILSEDIISDNIIAALLPARLLCCDAQINGTVMLNLPRTSAQLEQLSRHQMLIHKVLTYDDNFASIVDKIDMIAVASAKMSAPPFSNASLIETWVSVKTNSSNRSRVLKSRLYGYPVRMHDTSAPVEYLMATRSSCYQTYCPYMWSRESKLIDSFGDTTYSAEYCGEQFLFSSEPYLLEFLQNPQEFSGESLQLRSLPTVLPRILSLAETTKVQPDALEHVGCCPVTLYETREHKGLKGVTQPKAVLGDRQCIVEYNGRKYALVDKQAVIKFIQQPWVYVAGAVLPLAEKLPFAPDTVRTANTDVYVKRMLYENIARALLAVSEVRPKFPGLDARESALKFVALHLKANNEQNTDYRQRCYQENFSKYTERATLYKNIPLTAPTDPAEMPKFRNSCALWDDLQDNPKCYMEYQHPKEQSKPPAAIN